VDGDADRYAGDATAAPAARPLRHPAGHQQLTDLRVRPQRDELAAGPDRRLHQHVAAQGRQQLTAVTEFLDATFDPAASPRDSNRHRAMMPEIARPDRLGPGTSTMDAYAGCGR
jgi:hypothetical protein